MHMRWMNTLPGKLDTDINGFVEEFMNGHRKLCKAEWREGSDVFAESAKVEELADLFSDFVTLCVER